MLAGLDGGRLSLGDEAREFPDGVRPTRAESDKEIATQDEATAVKVLTPQRRPKPKRCNSNYSNNWLRFRLRQRQPKLPSSRRNNKLRPYNTGMSSCSKSTRPRTLLPRTLSSKLRCSTNRRLLLRSRMRSRKAMLRGRP